MSVHFRLPGLPAHNGFYNIHAAWTPRDKAGETISGHTGAAAPRALIHDGASFCYLTNQPCRHRLNRCYAPKPWPHDPI